MPAGHPAGDTHIIEEATGRGKPARTTDSLGPLVRTVLDHLPVILFAVDEQRELVYLGGSGAGRLGQAPEWYRRRHVEEVFADVPALLTCIDQAASGEEASSEVELAGALFRVTVAPPGSGGHPGLVTGVAVEVGERRSWERLARFQRVMLDSVDQAVIATDVHGRITAWNRSAEEIFGWSAEEATGQSIYDLTVPAEEELPAMEIMEQLAAGEPWSGDFPVRRRDGSTFLVHTTNMPMLNEHGDLVGIVGVSEDVTEQRRREAEEREAQQRREHFVSVASHEMRGPLTSILGFAARLRRLTAGDGPLSAHAGEVETLHAEATRMQRTVDLLLDVARLDAGPEPLRHEPLQREPLDLGEIVLGEIAALRRRHAGARCEERLPSEPVIVVSHDPSIRLVLANLLDNAVKYGGEPPAATVSVERVEPGGRDPGEVRVRVADNGAGVAPEERERIFERFYRSEQVAGQQGLGLGLYLSHQLAVRLGGSLTVSDRVGGGAEFVFALPLEPDEAPEARLD